MWAQITLLVRIDELARTHPDVGLSIYVDDANIGVAAPTEGACANTLCDAAQRLLAVVEAELGGDIAVEQAGVIDAAPALTHSSRSRLDPYVGPPRRGNGTLGVDYAAGRPRASFIGKREAGAALQCRQRRGQENASSL